jgi:catechol 2,3-dioxygenase-like lactoylglutathione lyase family enzyme
MSQAVPGIDFANIPAPKEGILVALFITVRKVARSRDFYSRVLGVSRHGREPLHREAVQFVDHHEPGRTTHSGQARYLGRRLPARQHDLNVHEFARRRHQACYEEWKAKGAEFVTPPIDRGGEIRCYMRDPDGYPSRSASPLAC